MSPVAAVLVLSGAVLCVVAALGLLRMPTTSSRVHAAGKASPVAFLLVAAGAALETGWAGAGRLLLAVAAVAITLPIGVQALLRAIHGEGDDAPGS